VIDSHAHLTSSELYQEVDAIVDRASSLEHIVNICTDLESLIKGIELKKRYPFIYNTCSTTPHDVKAGVVTREQLLPYKNDLVAIGETGLDYYYEHSPKEDQKRVFVEYLLLAKEWNLPVVIHCREAFNDLYDLMDQYFQGQKAVLHCFTGTLDEAKEGIKRGYFVSMSGIVTFKKSVDLQQVAKWLPLESMLIETDSPYLAPLPYRGQRNEPAFIQATCQFIADLKGLSFDEVANKTAENTKKLFALKS
jgi:TatD DNase family protein